MGVDLSAFGRPLIHVTIILLFGLSPLFPQAPAAFAQIGDLATTDDGSRVFFSSPLRERGSDQVPYPKIFAVDASGVHLIAQRQRGGDSPSNNFILLAPNVSGDGTVVTFDAQRVCYCCSSCFLAENFTGTVLTPATGGENTESGHVRLSRNGEFLVRYPSYNAPYPSPRLINLVAGDQHSLGTNVYGNRVTVASNGDVLFAGGVFNGSSGLELYSRQGDHLALPVFENVSDGVLDDSASTIVYENANIRLRVIDLKTKSVWPLGADNRDNYQPSISSDGSVMTYISVTGGIPQLFFSSRDGSEWKQLTGGASGITQSTLSGDGKVAYAATRDGQLLRIGTLSGKTDVMIGPTPMITKPTITIPTTPAAAPGSTYTLMGTGLLENAIVQDPSIDSLYPVRVTIAHRTCPLVAVEPDRISFQIPWEISESLPLYPMYSLGSGGVEAGDPRFEAAFEIRLASLSPQTVPLESTSDLGDPVPVIAIHEDFSALVTKTKPATPGEIVHLYATGLGAVDPPISTGAPPAAGMFPRVAASLRFSYDFDVLPGGIPVTMPVDVPYIGLAPGLIGYYQIDLRIPAVLPSIFSPKASIDGDRATVWNIGSIPVSPK